MNVPVRPGRALARRRIVAAALTVLAALLAGAPAAGAQSRVIGRSGWRVLSSAGTPAGGAQISDPAFSPAAWRHDRPDDGGGPGSEIAVLLQNHACPEVFRARKMAECFGYMDTVGPDTVAAFSVPWWFRSTFRVPARGGRYESLVVNGVVGEADVWVNGTEVASRESVQGAFTRYTFPVSGLVHPGLNAVALEVYPNDPTRMFTLDNVDWTQIPPDNNTGIQFPVELHESGALAISGAHVIQTDAPDLWRAGVTVKANVTNNSSERQTGMLSATITPPEGGTPLTVTRAVSLGPGATRAFSIGPGEAPQLQIAHPDVWWPHGMGAQPLYSLSMSVSQPHGVPDRESETFGIRTITSSLVGPSPLAPDGARRFAVNGHPLLFRAGGWAEDLFLRYSAARTADQIALIENLGLNGIRTEGKEMPADFYEQMDRAGILIDAGFQCCDNWQREEGEKEYSPRELKVIGNSALAIGERLRNHPSVLNYSWSDNAPTPRQEAVSLRNFAAADFQQPLIASAEYRSAPQLGPSGEKEGPYDWVPPGYWYDTSHFSPEDPSRTNVGGAWAFDSEASAGATIPTLDSIRRFLSPYEQAQLWQAPDYNQYHLNYETELPSEEANYGYAFGTLHDLDQAITHRYGPWSSLAGYVQLAQLANYETQRAEFEAYIAHSHATATTPSTGIVYWQLNKGWPTLLWDLYNYEYDQAGSYFGAKEANAGLHALYAYDTGTVTLDNISGEPAQGLSVRARVYDVQGRLLDEQSASGISLAPEGVASDVLVPHVPPATSPPQPAQAYFVELVLSREGEAIDRNVYWLSTRPDVVDWPKTIGLPQATMSQYGDLSQLDSLAPAEVSVSAHTHPQAGPDGADRQTDVTITNVSKTPAVAFFMRADIRRGSGATPAGGDDEVLPVFWSANDTTLWPGESETLSASYSSAALGGAAPVVSLSGFNVAGVDVAAP